MSYQAGIAADIEENSKAWKIRAYSINGVILVYFENCPFLPELINKTISIHQRYNYLLAQ